MRIQIALFFIFCCFLVVNCNKDKIIPTSPSQKLSTESRSIADTHEVTTLKEKIKTLQQQVQPYLSSLSPSDIKRFKVDGGAEGSFMMNNKIVDPLIRTTVLEMITLSTSVKEIHGEEIMKNAIFDGSLSYLIDLNSGDNYDVDIFALGTPCYDAWATATAYNLVELTACLGFASTTGGAATAACIVYLGIAQHGTNQAYEDCLDNTYGGG